MAVGVVDNEHIQFSQRYRQDATVSCEQQRLGGQEASGREEQLYPAARHGLGSPAGFNGNIGDKDLDRNPSQVAAEFRTGALIG